MIAITINIKSLAAGYELIYGQHMQDEKKYERRSTLVTAKGVLWRTKLNKLGALAP